MILQAFLLTTVTTPKIAWMGKRLAGGGQFQYSESFAYANSFASGCKQKKWEISRPAAVLTAARNAQDAGMMNTKHRKTLAAVFKEPTSKQLAWNDVESLLLAAGAERIEGRGSRVRFHKDGEIATFHRPHPHKEAKPYQIEDARDFLLRIGVKP